MSVQQLGSPVVPGWLEVASESVTAAAAVPRAALSDAELAEAVSEVAVLESQVAALKCEILAEADRRRVADETGDTGTDAWAARLTGSTRAVLAGGIWLANLLQTRYDATREAFASGGINQAQVRVIVRAGREAARAGDRRAAGPRRSSAGGQGGRRDGRPAPAAGGAADARGDL